MALQGGRGRAKWLVRREALGQAHPIVPVELIALASLIGGLEVDSATVAEAPRSSASSTVAIAPSPAADDDWWIGHAMLGGTLNPRAAGAFVGLRRHWVYHRDARRLFDGLWLDVGTEWVLSASIRPGVFVEWSPIKILKLKVQYEVWGWLGVQTGLGHGLVFADARSPFDPDSLKARQGEERPGFGQRLTFLPTLQLKLWRVIAFSTAEFAAWYVHGDGGYWLEPINDNLVKRGAIDGVFKNTAFLLFQLYGEGDASVLLGFQDEYVHSFSAGLSRHRLGLVTSITPFAELWGINRPTLLGLFGVNLEDQNRRHGLYGAIAIRLEMDFFKDAVPSL